MLFYNSLDSVLRDMIGLQINLARSAKLPTGLGYIYYLPFHFLKLSKAISGSTGPIFTIFFTNGRYLRECCQSGPVFPIPQGALSWQPILGKIGEMTYIQHHGILKRIGISQYG